ncbi:MAG: hypothetical protein WCV80_02065 [Candidatus Paceibacterota bacterium]|jgi:hypothetical protein
MDKKHSAVTKIAAGAFIFGVIIAYVAFSEKNVPKNEEQQENIAATSTSDVAISTSILPFAPTSTVKNESAPKPIAWKTYADPSYGFSFQYPAASKLLFSSSSNSMANAVAIVVQAENIAAANIGKLIEFKVYEKGTFTQYTEASACKLFAHSELVIDGKTIDIAEHEKCRGEEGVISSTHYMHAIIPLSENEIIVFTASLGDIPFGKADFAKSILDTFKFIPRV